MPRSRAGKVIQPLQFVVLVDHLQGNGAPQRDVAPDAAEQFHGVRFNPLPSAAAIPPLATAELSVNERGTQLDSGGKAVDEGHERLAVRFAGGPVT